jgi:hypothetical protein
MKNERFEAYYKAQNLLPENEWDKFMDQLREPLPTTFRVAGSRQLRGHVSKLTLCANRWLEWLVR